MLNFRQFLPSIEEWLFKESDTIKKVGNDSQKKTMDRINYSSPLFFKRLVLVNLLNIL